MDFKNLLNVFFTGLNAELRRGFKSVVDAVNKKDDSKEIKAAITVQTSTLKDVFQRFEKKVAALSTPEVEVKLDQSKLINALEKLTESKNSVDTSALEAQLNLILLELMENRPERLTESFDAFGKRVLELKPKDEVTINPKQIQGLMAAIQNSGTGASAPAPNSNFYSGRKVVTTAGTAVQLSDTSVRCENITIVAESDNTGIIAIGDANVVAAEGSQQGAILTPLGSITIKVGDLKNIYIDSTVSGDGVTFGYER